MMRALICVLAVAALVACKTECDDHLRLTNPQDLHIEIGRYGVMLGQTAEMTAEKPGDQHGRSD